MGSGGHSRLNGAFSLATSAAPLTSTPVLLLVWLHTEVGVKWLLPYTIGAPSLAAQLTVVLHKRPLLRGRESESGASETVYSVGYIGKSNQLSLHSDQDKHLTLFADHFIQ
ncbi:rCG65879 [Rattus norvegicus]|uniref:LRRGT00062 n=2 Tax=Rattus norvegicus TaxID=10116 RepID=A6K0S5_RAT|nr:LRRGT00062 [Rattus norvegicus]EDL88144.1 rCG65879 [Rattus norvegicus]|eukprot:NP_001041442.1 uncharacterized protein LOC685406 [Rattus norvegicus]